MFVMARSQKPWFRKDRQCWFVTIDGQRRNLGPDREAAFREFHELMARPKKRAVASKSVVAVIDAFLEWTQKHRAERTYEWYQQRCQWFVDAIPDLSVDQLQPHHVQEWLDPHPGWSGGHRRGCIIAVQRPFRCERRKSCSSYPAYASH